MVSAGGDPTTDLPRVVVVSSRNLGRPYPVLRRMPAADAPRSPPTWIVGDTDRLMLPPTQAAPSTGKQRRGQRFNQATIPVTDRLRSW
jgi:hypothetical protein